MDKPSLQILMIEDDMGDMVVVERMLQQCQQQYAIKHCQSLEDALYCLETDIFDLALLDLSLPDSFGLSALDKIRPSAPDMPIVVLTGLSDDNLALQALEQGAQDYIVKGSATAELLERTLRYAIQRQQIQSENRRLLQKMEELARHDPLTGVANRLAFSENLEREWKRSERILNPLSCVLLDIDFFKRINDSFGHAAGDQTLRVVADTLKSISRGSDFVGRIGGEEFCILLPDSNEEAAVAWAERVRVKIAELLIPVDRDELQITASMGVSSRRDDLTKPQQLVDHADEAMFVAKQRGAQPGHQLWPFEGCRPL